jgi:pimeloyl-ACP methyl ester carboxylesterase
MPAASAAQAIRAALDAEPDGVLDDIARRLGVPLRVVLDLLPPHYDGIKAFSETDLTEDLKSIDAPTLVMQGDDDQIVPYKGAALLQVKLLKNATLKLYPGFPHGMLTTYSETINQDLLAFIKT